MKLTLKQAKERMTQVWGTEAFLVPSRISGNRYVYAITDHGENWLPLDSSWSQGDQVFALVDAEWPEPDAGMNGHAHRIDLVVAYEADGARALPRINGNGQLVAFRADGVEATPPAQTVSAIYRWLQAEGYVPDGFKWLGWQHGLRQRRQTYVLNGSNGHHTEKEAVPCHAS